MAGTEHDAGSIDQRLRDHIDRQRELLQVEVEELLHLQGQVRAKTEHVERLRRSIFELSGNNPRETNSNLAHYPRKTTVAKVLATFDDAPEGLTYRTIEERSGLSHGAISGAVTLLRMQGRLGVRGRKNRQLLFEKV